MEKPEIKTTCYYVFNGKKEQAFRYFNLDSIIEVLRIKKFPEEMFFVIGKGKLLYIGGRISKKDFVEKYLNKITTDRKFEDYRYFFYINISKKDDYYHQVYKREKEKKEN